MTDESGDLLVTGRVATLAGHDGFSWVEAVAVRNGTVVGAGSREDVSALARGSQRLDLGPDEIAIPGFTDAHLHLGDAALAARQLDLEEARTIDDALALVAAAHARLGEGEWLLGHGWNGAPWGRTPAAADLERAAPGRAAFLWSHDHHSAWLSPAALVRAGLDASAAGAGVLHEDAVGPAMAALPATAGPTLERAIEDYAQSLLELGIVGVHDPGPLAPDPDLGLDMAASAALARAGRLPIRVHVSVRDDSLRSALERGLRTGDDLAPDGPLPGCCRVGWLKLFADGALGSRTAAMLEPYEREEGVELPGGPYGVMNTPFEELRRLVADAAGGGIATQIHAIGDAAVRSALDAFAAAGPLPGSLPAAPRLEHLQLVDPADLSRIAELGVVASVQPSHLLTDAAAAVAAWGERAGRNGYPYGELHRAGATLAFGSDAPVERADPWLTLTSAVWRSQTRDGAPLLGAHQRLAPDVALRGACVGPGAAAGRPEVGRLVRGSPADFLVVPARALEEPANVRPSAVFVEGVRRV